VEVVNIISVWIISLLYPLGFFSQFPPGRKVFFPLKTHFFPWEGKKYPFTRMKPNPDKDHYLIKPADNLFLNRAQTKNNTATGLLFVCSMPACWLIYRIRSELIA